MIFKNESGSLYCNPLDVLLLCGLFYLGFGLEYGFRNYGYVSDAGLYCLLGLVSSYAVFSRFSKFRCQVKLGRNQEWLMLFGATIGIVSVVVFYLYAGPSYFLIDKADRYAFRSEFMLFRVGFFSSTLTLTILMMEESSRFQLWKFFLLSLAIFVTMVEGDRQQILILAVATVLAFWMRYRVCLVPNGLKGLLVLAAFSFFTLAFFKPLFYIIFLQKQYSGGWFHITELTNWMRWDYLAYSQDVDLLQVQRNDLGYALRSIFLPYSSAPTSTGIWFNEVLGYRAVSGIKYGYSGPTWLSAWLKGPFIMLPWFLIAGVIVMLVRIKHQYTKMLFVLPVMFVIFRLFRSEWVLVFKTYLWMFVYPAFIFYLFANLLLASLIKNRGFSK